MTSSHLDIYWKAYPVAAHEMRLRVTLDTNIYIHHKFSTAMIDSFLEVKELFNDVVFHLPEAVERECEAKYPQLDFCAQLRKHCPPELRIDVAELTNKAKRHFYEWQAKLRSVADQSETTDSILRSAYERLMKKRAPCHKRDETRDAVIWESVLAPKWIGNTAYRVFITDNHKDFPFDTDAPLKLEAKAAKVLWFKSFADFMQWVDVLRPKPWEREIEFRQWYEEQNFVWTTARRLNDSLADFLSNNRVYFDCDVDLIDLNRASFSIESENKTVAGTVFVVHEEWFFSVRYGVHGVNHLGGSDGIEIDVSGAHEEVGSATIVRTLRFDSERRLVGHEIEPSNLKLDDDNGEWDPHEAWLDTLHGPRDG